MVVSEQTSREKLSLTIFEAIDHGRTDIVAAALKETEKHLLELNDDFVNFLNTKHLNKEDIFERFLTAALKIQNVDFVRTLMQCGSNPTLEDFESFICTDRDMIQTLTTFIITLIAQNNMKRLTQILDHDIPLSSLTENVCFWSITLNQLAILRLLMSKTCEPMLTNPSLLHVAIECGNKDAFLILLNEFSYNPCVVPLSGKWRGKNAIDFLKESSTCVWREEMLIEMKKNLDVWNDQNSKRQSLDSVSLCSSTSTNDKKDKEDGVSNGRLKSESPSDETRSLKGSKVTSVSSNVSDERASAISASSMIWPPPQRFNILRAKRVPFPQHLILSLDPGSNSVHELLDIFDFECARFNAVHRQVSLSESHPILLSSQFDVRDVSFDCHIHCTLLSSSSQSQHSAASSSWYSLTIDQFKCVTGQDEVSGQYLPRIIIKAYTLSGVRCAVMTLIQLLTAQFQKCFTLVTPSSVVVGELDEDKSTIITNEGLKDEVDEISEDYKDDTLNDVLLREDVGGGVIPLHIEDWSCTHVRAVLIDMNKFGRIPNFEHMFEIVRTLSYLKCNQLQLFVRLSHHSTTVNNTSPPHRHEKKNNFLFSYNHRSLLSLDRYCRDRGIELVPAVDIEIRHDSSGALSDPTLWCDEIRHVLNLFDRPRYVHVGPVLSSAIFNQNAKSLSVSQMCDLIFPSSIHSIFICANSILNSTSSSNQSSLLNCNRIIPIKYEFQNGNFTSLAKLSGSVGAVGSSSSSTHPVGICVGSCAWNHMSFDSISLHSNICGAFKYFNDKQIKANGVSSGGGPSLAVSIVAHWSSDPPMSPFAFAWPSIVLNCGLSWNNGYVDSLTEENVKHATDLHVFGVRSADLSNSSYTLSGAMYDISKVERSVNLAIKPSQIPDINKNTILLTLILHPNSLSSVIEKPGSLYFVRAIQILKKRQKQLSTALDFASPLSSTNLTFNSVKDEVTMTLDLCLLAAKIGRVFALMQNRSELKGQKNGDVEEKVATEENDNDFDTLDDLEINCKTDIANRLLVIINQYRSLWTSRYEDDEKNVSLRLRNIGGLKRASQHLNKLFELFVPIENLIDV